MSKQAHAFGSVEAAVRRGAPESRFHESRFVPSSTPGARANDDDPFAPYALPRSECLLVRDRQTDPRKSRQARGYDGKGFSPEGRVTTML